MKICRDLGGPLTNTGLAAAVVQVSQGKNGSRNTGCFKCGQPGHIRRQCPQQTGTGGQRPRVPGLYLKCKKGNHWAHECRSVKDIHGQPIEHDGARPKNGRRGHPTSGPSNIWGSHRGMAQFETANAVEQPRRATRGSSGLDFSSATPPWESS